MKESSNPIKRFFSVLLKAYRLFRSIIGNFFFLLFVVFIVSSIMSVPNIKIPQGAALVFSPQGSIVEEKTYIDPLNNILNGSVSSQGEIVLQDILNMFARAKEDDSISALILQLDSLQASGFSKLQDIGSAISDFKSSGKKVYAIADSYSQGQFYLASYADEIIVNPLGGVDLEGFSSYQTYYGSALEKIGVNMHIFRVGEYKSAVEPYERDDMSPEAKLANSAWLNELWQIYIEDISRERALNSSLVEQLISSLDQQLANFSGDTAEMALQTRLVDSVLSRTEISTYLKNEIGANKDDLSFKQVSFNDYLFLSQNSISPTYNQKQKIALIIATGTITDGHQRPGNIGGDSLANLILNARDDENIKALVLRIDSGGGSAFASEVIRDALVSFKSTGKPLIASMGSVAASGGYWIASPADQIWANPSTITGSIGIYSIYPTFENTLETIGIHTDGVGTTPLAGAFDVGRDLPEIVSNALQLNLQNGYDRFLSIVSQGRDMTTEEVDEIAKGRVWSGVSAQSIGLVDHLGDLQQAIDAAAELASLEQYSIEHLSIELSPSEQFIQDFTQNSMIKSILPRNQSNDLNSNKIMQFFKQVTQDIESAVEFNDPNGMYLHCDECNLY